MIKIKKSLDIPIEGSPAPQINNGLSVKEVALLGPDYVGMKPTMLVKEGDQVSLGDPLFEDKKNPGILYTSPAAGTVKAIHRGEKRALQSVVISVDGNNEKTFKSYSGQNLAQLSAEEVRENLIQSGLWTAFRQRPFSKVPEKNAKPSSIFVSILDTNPLAADPELIISQHPHDFNAGLDVLSTLTEKVFVNRKFCSEFQVPSQNKKVCGEEFWGGHPAGLVGTQIHFLDPVGPKKQVWSLNYQDVIAIGKLFQTGKIWTERYVSLAGPQVVSPSIVRTRLGANLSQLTQGLLRQGENRIISGSVLWGRHAQGALDFLGRYHVQVSVILEGRKRELLGWHMPGVNKFSFSNVFVSKILPSKLFRFTSNTNGSHRAMVPIGMFEGVMPMDINPTFLLRSLLSKDSDMAQNLGALELDEEDLGLCNFVCPGKEDYQPLLRNILTHIEKEG